ncbi:flagellin protein FlaA [Hydrogenimonas sp.]|nr:flagellin protein FlaA [Hydrogenimonas sp.]
MGFRINTNIAAMNAHRNSLQTNLNLNKDLEQLSSGLRINRAADDASGLAIANTLRQQSQGLGQAIANANDGIGVMQTADGALEEYENIINTIRTKAIQAASDGQNADTRAKIQADIDRLLEEAQNIASTTSFNGQTLLNGGFHDKSFHIGAYSGETVNISIKDAQIANIAEFAMETATSGIASGATAMTLSVSMGGTVIDVSATGATGNTSLENAKKIVDAFNAEAQSLNVAIRATVVETTANSGNYSVRLDSAYDFVVNTNSVNLTTGTAAVDTANNLSTVDVTSRNSAEKAIIITDYALRDIDSIRSDIGSVQNQLESTIRNISVTQVNVAAAESQIRDVDFAAVSASFNKNNILSQSGSYALSQANAVQQNVLRLLQ